MIYGLHQVFFILSISIKTFSIFLELKIYFIDIG